MPEVVVESCHDFCFAIVDAVFPQVVVVLHVSRSCSDIQVFVRQVFMGPALLLSTNKCHFQFCVTHVVLDHPLHDLVLHFSN